MRMTVENAPSYFGVSDHGSSSTVKPFLGPSPFVEAVLGSLSLAATQTPVTRPVGAPVARWIATV